MSSKIEIYTDGSSLIKGNYYEASSGVMIYIDGVKTLSIGTFHIDGTNSTGEVYATMLALDRIHDIIKDNPLLSDATINIYADSEYVVNSLTDWMWNWAKNKVDAKWVSSSGKVVMYQSIFRRIYKRYMNNKDFNKIKVFHIRGHIGEKVKPEKAYDYFIKKNKVNILMNDFMIHSKRNSVVDEIADIARSSKKYKEIIHDNTYTIYERDNVIRDGNFVIQSRNISENSYIDNII